MKYLILTLSLIISSIGFANSSKLKWKIKKQIKSNDSEISLVLEVTDKDLQHRAKIINGKNVLIIDEDMDMAIDESNTKFATISEYKKEVLILVRKSHHFDHLYIYDTSNKKKLFETKSFGKIEYNVDDQSIYMDISEESEDPVTERRIYTDKIQRWPNSVKANKTTKDTNKKK